MRCGPGVPAESAQSRFEVLPTMNTELEQLAQRANLSAPENLRLRLRFGYACAERVSQHLEDDRAIEALRDFGRYLAGDLSETDFNNLAQRILLIASGHRGSASIDGSQHSAVSATYALANAINGKAVEAAAYAAYSKVYGYGSYAVSDLDSFRPEHAAQVRILQGLLASESQARLPG